MMNQIIAHFQDGKVMRGHTMDFLPTKDRFHLIPSDQGPDAKPVEVLLADLKGVFFVKDLKGDGRRQKLNYFNPNDPPLGRKIRVSFKDGEVLQGYTQAYQPGRPSFFVIPADKNSNTERVFVLAAATKEVRLI